MFSKLQVKPMIYAVAGSPASGKTSFIQQMLKKKKFPEDAFSHDCDATMLSMEGYQKDVKLLGSVKAFEIWEIPAREMAEAILVQAVNKKENILYDRSCALESSYIFLMNLVENHGYELVMHVLSVPKEIAFLRAMKREQQTGRHIPEDIVLERMIGIKDLWPSYLKLAAACHLYDGNSPSYSLIAESKNSKLLIHDKNGYFSFLNPEL